MSHSTITRAVVTLFILGAAACSGSEEAAQPPPGKLIIDPQAAADIDAYVRSLGSLPYDAPALTKGKAGSEVLGTEYGCVSTGHSETKGYDSVVAYAANSSGMWPGAILRGDSVYSGLFTPLGYERAPTTFSVSLENLQGAKSATLEVPSLSSYREQVGQLLSAEVSGATAANIFSEVEQVHTEEQIALALGANASWPGVAGKIAASFDFSNVEKRSRYIVKFAQSYYTVDLDPPPAPHKFFDPSVTVEDLKEGMFDGSPPVYVSSVNYGRMVIFTVESSLSNSEMDAAIDFSFKGGADVAGSTSLTFKEMVSSSKITAYILGGSADEAVKSIDSYDALIAFIKNGGDYSPDSPGAPIGYRLSHLKDNSPARLSFTQDYDALVCERITQKVRVTLENIKVEDAGGDAGNDLELYGSIFGFADSAPQQLFDRTDANYVTVAAGETWPQSGQIGEIILTVDPQSGSSITLSAWLHDDDGVADDLVCDQTVLAPFESGWRRSLPILCTGSGTKLTLGLTLQPI